MTDHTDHRQYLAALNAAREEAGRIGEPITDDRPLAAFHRHLVTEVIAPLRDELAHAQAVIGEQRAQLRRLTSGRPTTIAQAVTEEIRRQDRRRGGAA